MTKNQTLKVAGQCQLLYHFELDEYEEQDVVQISEDTRRLILNKCEEQELYLYD